MNPTPQTPVWFVLTRHWLSLAGAALATTAGITLLFIGPLRVRGHADNPYVGIITLMIVPMVFFLGLLLIPIGVYLEQAQDCRWNCRADL